MAELVENIIDLMDKAPRDKWSVIGGIIEEHTPYGLINVGNIEVLRQIESKIKRTLGKGIL